MKTAKDVIEADLNYMVGNFASPRTRESWPEKSSSLSVEQASWDIT